MIKVAPTLQTTDLTLLSPMQREVKGEQTYFVYLFKTDCRITVHLIHFY